MGRIKESDYAVFTVIKIAKEHAVGTMLDPDIRIREYYKKLDNNEGRAIFYFSDTTMKRVENMDTAKLNAEDILPICHKSENRTGIVLSSENYRRLCFGYTISENQIIIGVYRSSKSSMHSANPNSVISNIWLGSIIISESGVEIIPSTLFPILFAIMRGESVKGRIDKDHLPALRGMRREIIKYTDAFHRDDNALDDNARDDNMRELYFDMKKLSQDERIPWTKREAMAYLFKYDLLLTALKMFLFLKTASVIQQTYISEDKGRTYERKQGTVRNYVLVDSTWDSDITVLNPFAVRGHFRHQPKKDERGRWYRDLIYIDAFMKKGYHRRATKVLQD